MKQWVKDLHSRGYKRKDGMYSQLYQDRLLEDIFQEIGTGSDVPFCVEFGFNAKTLTGGSGSNVAKFLAHKGWSGVLFDIKNSNPSINLYKHALTTDNVLDVFEKRGVPKSPDLVCIDIDSADLWIFETLIKEYKSRVYMIEYNPRYPLEAAVTFPNDPSQSYMKDTGYGASLRALNMVAEANGYTLVWVVKTLDLVFVRNDLLDDGSGELGYPLEKWRDCTDIKVHVPLKSKGRFKNFFVDYEEYLRSGDLNLAKQAANKWVSYLR